MLNRLDNTDEPVRKSPPPDPEYLEIDLGRKRRWLGWVGYILFFGLVCAVLVYLFLQFNTPYALAVGVVLFMVAYMVLMGWWASRNLGEQRRRE